MSNLIAKIIKIHHGETKMGTGPYGGHRGHAYLADVIISSDQHENLRKYKNDFISDSIPTKEDMEKHCKYYLKRYKEDIRREVIDMASEEKESKKMHNLNEMAASIIVRD